MIFSPWCPSDRVQHRLPYTLKLLQLIEGSTIISEQFEKVKHQFVWPDMLLKWLIGKTNGHEESRYKFELFQVFFFGSRYVWLLKKFMSFMAHEETTFMLNLSSQGATLNFYCLKKIICFYSHMTSHWQMLFSDIFNG